jgi:hypothetical protein
MFTMRACAAADAATGAGAGGGAACHRYMLFCVSHLFKFVHKHGRVRVCLHPCWLDRGHLTTRVA